MKLQTWVVFVVLGTALAARGGVYTKGAWSSGFASGGNIPDGRTAGWSDTRSVSDIPSGLAIANVTCAFTISGAYNGDLYGCLSHDGMLVPLLNRVGTGAGSDPAYSFGYGDGGFSGVTLADGGANGNIHNYGGTVVPSGTYAPDSGGVTFAGTFGGLNPNGTWTLFLADLSSGGGQSQLTSLRLGITEVPEPVNVALGIFAGVVLVVILARSRPVRNRVHRWRLAVVEWINAV